VATFDWRSQGGSRRSLADTTKVHVRSFDEYQLDLQAFVSQGLLQDCPPPYYALAQSVGAAILLDGMDRGLNCFERVVVQSPTLFSYRRYPKWYVTTVGQALKAVGLGNVALRSTWHIDQSAAWLTADPALRDRYWAISQSHPSLISKSRTAAWSVSYNRAHTKWVGGDFGATIRTPVLFTIGGKDPVIELPAVKAMAGRIPGASLAEIPGGRHIRLRMSTRSAWPFGALSTISSGLPRHKLRWANPRAFRP